MENQANIITVSGVSRTKVLPNQLEIEVTSKSSHDTSTKANIALLGNVRIINDVLNRLQINDVKAEICTSEVTQESDNIYDRRSNVTGKRVYFNAILKVSLKMDIDHPSYEQLLLLLGKEVLNAEINVSYQLKDPTEYTLKALADAVKYAKSKAEVIVNACDCQLKDIARITESCSCDNEYVRRNIFFDKFNCSGFGAPKDNTEPEKILVVATVNITWNIDKRE